jgi:DNA processing protein
MTELDALLTLNAVPGLSNYNIKKLVRFYGSASKVLSLKTKDIPPAQAGLSKYIEKIQAFPRDAFLKHEYAAVAKQQVKVVTFQNESYPDLIKHIDDAPVVLYVKGRLPLPAICLAVVGSRKSSLSGRLTAEKFAYQLSERGFAVVSGMARGIDTSAHHGTLKAAGRTVAVLGSGLACVYPRENRSLYERIADSAAVISEFPMKTAPLPYNFPRRNRIISGLSLGVIVVEAAQKSGALITADFALEQGREVYAVPGNIEKATSQGVHNLIKQGAKMITSIDDVLEDMEQIDQYLSRRKEEKPVHKTASKEADCCSRLRDESFWEGMNQSERSLYDQLKRRPVHIDDLAEVCGYSCSFTASVLLQLELKNKIKQLPGKFFTKK